MNKYFKKDFFICCDFNIFSPFFCFTGGLFHPGDDHQEIAFRYAVDKINSDRNILPRSKLLAQIERISPQDSFHASKRGDNLFIFKPFCVLYDKLGLILLGDVSDSFTKFYLNFDLTLTQNRFKNN